ncbi:MAG: hypothetical protein DCE90_05235 [Pseudanabaena sp.]|nr:MAG: hypothetical protein DCE90_05235 [Pseudanabaena sp.]
MPLFCWFIQRLIFKSKLGKAFKILLGIVLIAKQGLVSTNQKPEGEWRRGVPPLAFWFYVLSKTFFAIHKFTKV